MKNNETLEHCNECMIETTFTKHDEGAYWTCNKCGSPGYWDSVEVLISCWWSAFVEDDSTLWRPENDSGMDEYHGEILVRRLKKERDYWKNKYRMERVELSRYTTAIKVFKEIFTK